MAISYLNYRFSIFLAIAGNFADFLELTELSAQKHTMSESLNNAWPALNFN